MSHHPVFSDVCHTARAGERGVQPPLRRGARALGVGRGGNACFPTFRLERDGPTDQPTNQPTNGRTDKASYRVACPRLKIQILNRGLRVRCCHSVAYLPNRTDWEQRIWHCHSFVTDTQLCESHCLSTHPSVHDDRVESEKTRIYDPAVIFVCVHV